LKGGMPEAATTMRSQLEHMRFKGDKQSSVYGVHSICCTRFRPTIMAWRDSEEYRSLVFCADNSVVEEKVRDER
jgi:hypothetical protein